VVMGSLIEKIVLAKSKRGRKAGARKVSRTFIL